MKPRIPMLILLLASVTVACTRAPTQAEQEKRDAVELDDLIVAAGETLELPARTYRFRNIWIERGATLSLLEGSNRWLLLWADGDIKIEGQIIGRAFRGQGQTVTDRTPDNRRISHSYENTSVGGNGGLGGAAQYHGQSRAGGRGATGTTLWGGGGGSGGGLYMFGAASRLTEPGRDAVDWQAAPASPYGTESNGHGARTVGRNNGAPILLRAGGIMRLAGGSVDLRGRDGEPGQRAAGTCPGGFPGGNRGGTGGGGGGPGGDGGQLILIAANFEGLDRFTPRVDGGAGGPGGGTACTFGGATAGTPGQKGAAGFVDRFTLDEWAAQPLAD
jgi:hypothetical protein